MVPEANGQELLAVGECNIDVGCLELISSNDLGLQRDDGPDGILQRSSEISQSEELLPRLLYLHAPTHARE